MKIKRQLLPFIQSYNIIVEGFTNSLFGFKVRAAILVRDINIQTHVYVIFILCFISFLVIFFILF